ncbi:MAG TPA: hypothetical protein VNQ76_14115 [Planctomicrobium sp.]|nr:hypothetical protein [Planctomicrobium sp.]
MGEFDLQILADNPPWRRLLDVYLEIVSEPQPMAARKSSKTAAVTIESQVTESRTDGSPTAADSVLEESTETEPEKVEPSGPRWADRVISMNEVTPDELSKIHGKLIAMGWLHFQLEDGQNGLVYRVSPEGRRLLKRLDAFLKSRDESCAPREDDDHDSVELPAQEQLDENSLAA